MRAAAYGLACLVGALAIYGLLPLATILGYGGLWVAPTADVAQNVVGHLIFQRPGWHWPLLFSPDLFWPRGIGVAMVDANPLLSIFGKFVASIRGEPANLMGFWLALCWLLQPIAAVYALRGFGAKRPESALAGAIVAVCFPALLIRHVHINLCGHFIVLVALGWASRMLRDGRGRQPRDWIGPSAILFGAVLVHPYLFVFDLAVLFAPVLAIPWSERRIGFRAAACCLGGAIPSVLVYLALSGTLGAPDSGFGKVSMNLLSPIWPQRSGIFGADLPILDATGGQWEGFNYLGLGGLILIALAIAALARGGVSGWRVWRPLGIVLVGLTMLALTTRVFAGNTLLWSFLVRPLGQVFGLVQSTGRAFWPVGYTLLLGSIAVLDRRLGRWALPPVLLLATMVQIVDCGPLWREAEWVFRGPVQAPPIFAMPAGGTLLTTAPLCPQPGFFGLRADTLRYTATLAGMRLSDIRPSRMPGWLNCDMPLSDATELPLRDGEVRVLLEPVATSRFRAAAMGKDALCGGRDGAIVCTKGTEPVWREPVADQMALARVAIDGPAFAKADLTPLLSLNWRQDDSGAAWSTDPRATLLFALDAPPPARLTVRLRLAGIAQQAGKTRPIVVTTGRMPPATIALPDLTETDIVLRIPGDALTDGIVRIAIDIDHPIDTAKRVIQSPVTRAGVRLISISVESSAAPL